MGRELDSSQARKIALYLGLGMREEYVARGMSEQNLGVGALMAIFTTVASVVGALFFPLEGHTIYLLTSVTGIALIVASVYYRQTRKRLGLCTVALALYISASVMYGIFFSIVRTGEGDHFMVLIAMTVWANCIFLVPPVLAVPSIAFIYSSCIHFAETGVFDEVRVSSMAILGTCVSIASMIRYMTTLQFFSTEKQLRIANDELGMLNRKLEMTSRRDALTGLLNRYSLRRDFEGYEGFEICVMLADIDEFKRVNDTSGHESGDHLLVALADLMRLHFGNSCCYRYGGDEFLVISKIDSGDFDERAHRVLEEFCAQSGGCEGARVTCSMGYVYGLCSSAEDLRDFLRAADARLYEAKGAGKSRIVSSCYAGEDDA